MRIFDKISLRLRLTLFMGIILAVSCTVFLIASNSSAKDVYAIVPGAEANILPEHPNPDKSVLQEKAELIKHEQDDEFALKNGAIALIITLLGTGITYFIAGEALKPVRLLSEEVKKIDENSLSFRIMSPETKDEVAVLTASFNYMMERIDKAFTVQKNFSANAAHELKTPLAGIISSIEVLLIDSEPSVSECRETLHDCLTSAERLSSLVNDLLEMNRRLLPSGCERFSIQHVFEQAAEDFSVDIESRNLSVDIDCGDIDAFGEKEMLSRVLYNLLHNAVRYNKDNGAITVKASQTDNQVTITVSDTGIGIPESETDSIFEPFCCVDKSRSRELGGSGLGLAIAKTIIEKHSGAITVKSTLGQSTVFTVTLPSC